MVPGLINSSDCFVLIVAKKGAYVATHACPKSCVPQSKVDVHMYATNVSCWTLEFEMKNMGEYHDFHLWIDGLDPCHYFSCPRLSWDVIRKMTDARLDQFLDIDMHQFTEKGRR